MSKPAKQAKQEPAKREPLGDYGLQASASVPDGPNGFKTERVRCVSDTTELQDGDCVVGTLQMQSCELSYRLS